MLIPPQVIIRAPCRRGFHKHILLALLYSLKKRPENNNPDIGTFTKKVTGRELDLLEEMSIRLGTLIELLHDKGFINKKEFESRVAMHSHEISKATAFEAMDELILYIYVICAC